MTSEFRELGAAPVTVALVNDYEVAVEHLRQMLAPFATRVAVLDMEVGSDDVARADVALFDTLGGQRHAVTRAGAIVEQGRVGYVVIYARDPSPAFVRAAEAVGVTHVIDKSSTGEDLVEIIEAVASGRPLTRRERATGARRNKGDFLTMRDHELLALLALGLSNEQIADELFIGVETVRTHLHRLFQRLDVRNRTQAALRAAGLGLVPVRPGADERLFGRRHTRHFRFVSQDVRSARAFVVDLLRRCGATDEEIDSFRLTVSELASNAVMHGARPGWTVGLKVTRNWCTIDVSSGTTSFDSAILHPERWTMPGAEEPTGRGLGSVQQLMDEVSVDVSRGRVRVVCRRRRTSD